MTRILFVLPLLGHPRLQNRIRALEAAGAEVVKLSNKHAVISESRRRRAEVKLCIEHGHEPCGTMRVVRQCRRRWRRGHLQTVEIELCVGMAPCEDNASLAVAAGGVTDV